MRVPRLARVGSGAAALLLAAACGEAEQADAAAAATGLAPADFVSITLERTPCYGYCPAYEVTIHADGRVVYVGHDFVEATGERTATLDAGALDTLLDAVRAADFRALDAAYRTKTREDGTAVSVSDLPTRITTLRTRDGEHRVENYFGGPPALAQLEDTIDRLAGTAAWIGDPPRPGGGD